ncbi:MbtH family protein [Streptomyces sp. NPDC007901]|uniref:MbtH family protein n=1 Tax=Streptomyces sp. NPDC007901 TaxID=3364785 RepID=UPI0036E9EFBB
MRNPFDDPNGTFAVLRNEENQHSLWPAGKDIPEGWSVVLRAGTRKECVEYIERNWADIRPAGLVRTLSQ